MINIEQILSLCKRRGFFYPSGEMYNGIRGFCDYGPLGAQLKKNIKDAWWRDTVTASPVDVKTREPLNIIPFEGSIVTNPKVWEGSGFTKNMPKQLISVGLNIDGKSNVYLRPEISQSVFSNFNNIVQTNRLRIPFGVAQVGKVFRNSTNCRHGIFRSRESEQMNIEWFCEDEYVAAEKWYSFWFKARLAWWQDIGLDENLIERLDGPAEKQHYTFDEGLGSARICFRFPFGWEPIEFISHRNDLKVHTEFSGYDLSYFDQERERKYYPNIIESSCMLDRAVLAILCAAYTVDEDRPCKEFMKIEPRIAPIKVAFFPLENRDGLKELAYTLFSHYRRKFDCVYDENGSVGKRYARMDEIGTPFCITIDSDTLSSDTVTVRFRDTMEQQRIDLESLDSFLAYNLG